MLCKLSCDGEGLEAGDSLQQQSMSAYDVNNKKIGASPMKKISDYPKFLNKMECNLV